MPRPDQSRQLALELPFEERRGSEDFFVGPSNEAAWAAVEAWPDWPDPLLVLVGPEGSGKSHLAGIWAERAHAWRRSADAIADAPHLASAGALVIEDIDRGAVDEASFFHLLNMMRDRDGFILATARSEPSRWRLATPDLASRIRRAPLARIAAPDDALLRALLVKLFLDRQLTVDTAVIETIIARSERSFAAARRVVEALDQAGLSLGRRITRAMAQTVIESLDPAGRDPSDGAGV